MEIEIKYGVAGVIRNIPLIGRGTTIPLAGATLAAGDFLVRLDGGAFANIYGDGEAPGSDLITEVSNGFYDIPYTAAEATCAQGVFYLADQTSPPLWEPQTIRFTTYGNASAQHPFDRGTALASQTVGTCTVNADMRGTDNALLAASAPTNFGDLAIAVTTGRVDVGSIEGVDATDAINAACDTAVSDAALATASALSTHDGKIDTLTTTVGVAGAGLTDLGGMSTGMKAQVNAECDTAVGGTPVTLANGAHGGSSTVLTLRKVIATAQANEDAIALTASGTGRAVSADGGTNRFSWITNQASSILAASALTGISGLVTAGDATFTTCRVSLTEATADHYKNRWIYWYTGALAGQAARITAYTPPNGGDALMTFTAVTDQPPAGSAFVIL